jgi:uncharacterized protein YlxW (UPF0749 family)
MGKLLGIKITPAHSAIAIICFVICFAVSLQIRSVISNFGNVMQVKQLEDFARQLVDSNNKAQGFFEQAQEFKQQLEKYEQEKAEQSDANAEIVARLHRMEILAGLADVRGQGVVVKMNDAASRPAGANASSYIIHERDLLWLLNELRNAGAEAISINGERLISTSDIRCVGSTITINGQKKVPPFEIRAIGNSTNLDTALKMQGGILEILGLNLDISCEKASDITVPRYSRPIEFNHAQPVAAEEAKAQ